MKHILVLCTGNSCRSQMAEGYLRKFFPNLEIYSAGMETHGLNPLAIKVMAEDGLDISGHTSNHVDEYCEIEFDLVITVCDHAREQCPLFSGNVQMIHQDFHDPSRVAGPSEEVLPTYHRTRDEIKEFVQGLSSIDFMVDTQH